MLNFAKARAAFSEIRNMHIRKPETDPKAWDFALGLESMVAELDSRLSAIERNQHNILQTLEQLRSKVSHLKP